MPKQVTISDIAYSLPTVKREIEAFHETRTEHDRVRALKAIDMLISITKELRLSVLTMENKPDDVE